MASKISQDLTNPLDWNLRMQMPLITTVGIGELPGQLTDLKSSSIMKGSIMARPDNPKR